MVSHGDLHELRSSFLVSNMVDGSQHLLIFQKINGQSYLFSTLSPNLQSRNTSVHSLSSAYVNGGLQTSLLPASNGNGLAWPLYHPCLPSLLKLLWRKVQKVFMIDFLMGGVSIAVSKSAAASIERVKLLIQNRDEIIKATMLSELYKGITDCFARTNKNEDVFSL